MRTLYFECNAGASGDMIIGALAGLLDDPGRFIDSISRAGIPHVKASLEKGDVFGIAGLRAHISIDGAEEGHEGHHGHHDQHAHHEHHKLSDVVSVIQSLNISDKVKKDACEIYQSIAQAESEAHGEPVDLIHFHEVGALDAVADVVGACLLIDMLAPEEILVSPIRIGYGQVRCAHGLLPIPAPATASLIKGMPVYAGDEEGEFCTPTGAAILKHFATRFCAMPTMQYDKVGCGLGYKKFRTANMLRAFMGQTENDLPVIKELTCNIDDMDPESLGRMVSLLLSNGALDAFISPSLMKKGRPGFELTCLSTPELSDTMARLILAHTSTIGLRIHDCVRYAQTSRFETVDTEYGKIRVKVSEGFGITKWKPESDDVEKAAISNNVPVSEVRSRIRFNPDCKN